jgi:adenylate cyclase
MSQALLHPGAPAVPGLIEWLVGDECRALDDKAMIERLGARLRATAPPLDRLTLHLRTLHPQIIGRTLAWAPGEPVEVLDREYGVATLAQFVDSPLRQVMETRRPMVVRLDPADTDENVLDVFRGRGLTELVILPLCNGDGPASAAAFATARASGFTPEERAAVERIAPALSTVCELRVLRRVERILLDTYVGSASGERVLAGHIRRGDCEMIEAALMFCDLHDFTALSNRLPAEHVLSLLNLFFDQVVPAVETEGGQLLKFLGDGVLATFALGRGAAADCAAAFAAARSVLSRLDALPGPDPRPSAGIALHHGETSYGNIGSGRRLDFTVIGPAVNLTSRLQGLCAPLSCQLLMSQHFAGLLGRPDVRPLGAHRVKGFTEPIEIFGWGR